MLQQNAENMPKSGASENERVGSKGRRLLRTLDSTCESLNSRFVRCRRRRPALTLVTFIAWAWFVFYAETVPYSPTVLAQRVRDTIVEQLDTMQGRHLVFCVSPGRAGSKYLQAVLGSAHGVQAFHEPWPQMNQDTLRMVVLEGRRTETLPSRAHAKLGAIERMLAGSLPHIAYAESSHMFVKTFGDVMLDSAAQRVQNVTILVLHRELASVVRSQLRLGWFSPDHSGRDSWYYDARDANKSEQVIGNWISALEGDGALEKLLAYNADIKARADVMEDSLVAGHRREEMTNIALHHVNVQDLNSTHAAVGLLELLALKPDGAKLRNLHAQDRNERKRRKDPSHADIAIDAIWSQIRGLRIEPNAFL